MAVIMKCTLITSLRTSKILGLNKTNDRHLPYLLIINKIEYTYYSTPVSSRLIAPKCYTRTTVKIYKSLFLFVMNIVGYLL